MPPDYSGENLQGRSFEGKDLTGANFSKADIRGADFTNATLKDADFTGAKAGIQKCWVIGLLIVAFLVSAIIGFFSIIIGAVMTYYIFNLKNPENFIVGIFCLAIVTVFCLVTIRKSLIAGTGAGGITGALALVVCQFSICG